MDEIQFTAETVPDTPRDTGQTDEQLAVIENGGFQTTTEPQEGTSVEVENQDAATSNSSEQIDEVAEDEVNSNSPDSKADVTDNEGPVEVNHCMSEPKEAATEVEAEGTPDVAQSQPSDLQIAKGAEQTVSQPLQDDTVPAESEDIVGNAAVQISSQQGADAQAADDSQLDSIALAVTEQVDTQSQESNIEDGGTNGTSETEEIAHLIEDDVTATSSLHGDPPEIPSLEPIIVEEQITSTGEPRETAETPPQNDSTVSPF